MEKIRVYQLARDLDTNSKRLMEKLAEVGVIVKNHMSLLEDDELDTLYRHIGIKTKALDTERAVLGASTPAQQTVGSKQPDAALGVKPETSVRPAEDSGLRETVIKRQDEHDGALGGDRGIARDGGVARRDKSAGNLPSQKTAVSQHDVSAKKNEHSGDTGVRRDLRGAVREGQRGGGSSDTGGLGGGSGGDSRSQQSSASARTQKDARNAPRIIRTTEINLDRLQRDDKRDSFRQGGSPSQQQYGQVRRGGGMGSGAVGSGSGGQDRQIPSRRDGGRGRDRDRRRRDQGYDRGGDHFRATESNSGLIAGFTRMTREESMKQLLAEARAQQKKLAQLTASGLDHEQTAHMPAGKSSDTGLIGVEKPVVGIRSDNNTAENSADIAKVTSQAELSSAASDIEKKAVQTEAIVPAAKHGAQGSKTLDKVSGDAASATEDKGAEQLTKEPRPRVPAQAAEATGPDTQTEAKPNSEAYTQAAVSSAQADAQTQELQQPRTSPVIYRADGTRLETVKADYPKADSGRRGDTSKVSASASDGLRSDGPRVDGRGGGEPRGDYSRTRQSGFGTSPDGRSQQHSSYEGRSGVGQQRAPFDGRSRPKASFDGRAYQQRTQQGQEPGQGFREGQGQGQGTRDSQGQGQRGFYRDRDRGDRTLGQAPGYNRGGGAGYRGGSHGGSAASGGGQVGAGYGYRQGQGQVNRPYAPRDGNMGAGRDNRDGRQQYGQGGGQRYGSGGYGGGQQGGGTFGARRPGGGFASGGAAGSGMTRQRPTEFKRPDTLGKPTETGAAKNEQKREFLRKDSAKEVKKDLKREGTKPAPVSAPDKNRRFRPQVSIIGEKKGVHEFSNDDFIIREFYESSDSSKRVRRQQRGRKGLGKEKYIPPRAILTSVTIPENLTVKELAETLKKTAGDVIKKLMGMGLVATINESLDYDTAALIAGEFGIEAEKEVVVSEEDILFDDADAEEGNLEPRAPVVVVMGHVDHGKTSLLDAIRNTNVISSEAGGITQHIGAYKVTINGHAITFLDTPGHEAFTSMRARGAMVTDIAILVVSAVDGVMPQTIEAINHAKAANVSIIIAINMMDREGANPERVKQELTEYGIIVEEWGGDIIAVPVSAKTGENIGQLLEMVLLTADMLELRASSSRQAKGTVIEAKLDKNRGPVATLLVQRGTLRVGDSFITGTTLGRIRAMLDDRGNNIREAGPSTPVEIIGLSEVPGAGEVFYVTTDDKVTKSLAEKRRLLQREEQLRSSSRVTLDDLFSQIQEGKVKDLNLIIKADVQGSAEAVRNSLEKLGNDDVRINIIHTGVGAINESDVSLASVSNAIIIGFNVRPGGASVIEAAETVGVDLRLYTVIYNAIEDIQAAMKGMLDPTYREVVLGHVEIRQIFKASGVGTIGGCYVLDGKIQRSNNIRVLRDGVTVFDGKLASLRRFKDDAREVLQGFECGISVERFNDIKENDIIEPYTMEEVPAG